MLGKRPCHGHLDRRRQGEAQSGRLRRPGLKAPSCTRRKSRARSWEAAGWDSRCGAAASPSSFGGALPSQLPIPTPRPVSSCPLVPITPCSLASCVCSLSPDLVPVPACAPLCVALSLFPSLSSRLSLPVSGCLSLAVSIPPCTSPPDSLYLPYLSPSLPEPLLLPFPGVVYTSILERLSLRARQPVPAPPCLSAHHPCIPPAGGTSRINPGASCAGPEPTTPPGCQAQTLVQLAVTITQDRPWPEEPSAHLRWPPASPLGLPPKTSPVGLPLLTRVSTESLPGARWDSESWTVGEGPSASASQTFLHT